MLLSSEFVTSLFLDSLVMHFCPQDEKIDADLS